MSQYGPEYTSGRRPDDMGADGQFTEMNSEFQGARDRLKAAYETARERSSEAIGQAEEYTRRSPREALVVLCHARTATNPQHGQR